LENSKLYSFASAIAANSFASATVVVNAFLQWHVCPIGVLASQIQNEYLRVFTTTKSAFDSGIALQCWIAVTAG
jgi:hypothetical protein